MGFLSRHSSAYAYTKKPKKGNADRGSQKKEGPKNVSESVNVLANDEVVRPDTGAGPSKGDVNTRLVYAALAHGKYTLLTDYDTDPGSPAKELAHKVLEKLDLDQDAKVSFVFENYTVNYITRPRNIPSSAPFGLTYLVVIRTSRGSDKSDSSEETGATVQNDSVQPDPIETDPVQHGRIQHDTTQHDDRRLSFLFLMDLQSIFRSKYLGRCVGSNVEKVLLGKEGSAPAVNNTTINTLPKATNDTTTEPLIPTRNTDLDRDIKDLLGRAERHENDLPGLARPDIQDIQTVFAEKECAGRDAISKHGETSAEPTFLLLSTGQFPSSETPSDQSYPDQASTERTSLLLKPVARRKRTWRPNSMLTTVLALVLVGVAYLGTGLVCGLPCFGRCF